MTITSVNFNSQFWIKILMQALTSANLDIKNVLVSKALDTLFKKLPDPNGALSNTVPSSVIMMVKDKLKEGRVWWLHLN